MSSDLSEKLRAVAADFEAGNDDDLLAALGNGDVSVLHVVQALRGEPVQAEEPPPPAQVAPVPTRGVRVRGVENVLMRFSRCCTPLPGDRIIGYVTRGRGVTIHRADCPNTAFFKDHPERMIEVEWEVGTEGSYQVEIEVEGFDRVGLLKDVLAAIGDSKTNVVTVNARVRRDKVGLINLVLDIRNVAQLHTVLQRVGKVPDVYSVERVVHS